MRTPREAIKQISLAEHALLAIREMSGLKVVQGRR
jgi:hypothetical protein